MNLTPEQDRAMNALLSGAYIKTNGHMYTAGGTYFRILGSRSFTGMIKKGVVKMVEKETEDGETERVWIRA